MIGKNGGVDLHTYLLETLARKKFDTESKQLLRRFLETVPSNVVEHINMKRKEKFKWTNERLRLCIGHRKTNKRIVKDTFPMRLVFECVYKN